MNVTRAEYVEMLTSPWHIKRTPFYPFEKKSRSRRHNQYTLFVMHLFENIRSLRSLIEESSIHTVSISSNEHSEDEVVAAMTLKECGRRWRLTNSITRKAWSYRANGLNKLPPVGYILQIPDMLELFQASELLCMDINSSWKHLITTMHRGMTSRHRLNNCNRFSLVGIERIRRSKMLCVEMYLSWALIFSLLGYNYSAVTENIVMKTTRTTVIHLWTPNDIQRIFNFANENAAKYDDDEYHIELCGKVQFTK